MGNQVTLTVLTELYERRGFLSPAVVVEEATRKDHPLHKSFDWDDTSAAKKYRLSQARRLIASVKIKIQEPEVTQLRAFVSVPSETGVPSYHPLEEAATDPMMRAIALQQMSREWKLLRQKYQQYSEFWDLLAADLAKEAQINADNSSATG